MPDPRKRRGRRHCLAGPLAVRIAAVIAGARSFAAISHWAADAGPDALASRARRDPRRGGGIHVPARVRAGQPGRPRPGARCLAVDQGSAGRRPAGHRHRREDRPRGKAQGREAPHLVAALAHGIGAVGPGRGRGGREEQRDTGRAGLLKAFASLAGAVITIDALHTQGDTAQVITGRAADCVMTVKANMSTVHKRLKKRRSGGGVPWRTGCSRVSRRRRPSSASTSSRSAGRRCRCCRRTARRHWTSGDLGVRLDHGDHEEVGQQEWCEVVDLEGLLIPVGGHLAAPKMPPAFLASTSMGGGSP